MSDVPNTSQEFLEWLMEYSPTGDELQQWLDKGLREDLFWDYKDGRAIDNKAPNKIKPADLIRQYVTGFANSEGGVLIIGVKNDGSDEDIRLEVTGAKSRGHSDLAEWASDCLTSVKGYISPPPRFYNVSHHRGNVLVIATRRSSSLIPLSEGTALTYWFRLHDKNLKAPEYLIADLLMGRRERPYLGIRDFSFMGGIVNGDNLKVACGLGLLVENEGFLKADDVGAGIVGWFVGSSLAMINRHLATHIEVQDISPTKKQIYTLLQKSCKFREASLSPFVITATNVTGVEFIIRTYDNVWHEGVWEAAFYLYAKGMPPIWYQLRLAIDSSLLNHLRSHPGKPLLAEESSIISFEKLPSGQRPVVAWHG